MRRGRHRREQGHRPGHHPGPRRRGRRGSSPALGETSAGAGELADRRACSRSWWTCRRPTDRRTWSPPPWTRGRLDILVNNVGRGARRGSTASWRSPTTSGCAHEPQPDGGGAHHPRGPAGHARRRARARIVTISSVNAFLPDPAVIDYSAAKAALTNFSKSLSKEVGPRASGSTRSAPGRWPPICGWATTASRPRSAGRADATRTRSRRQAAGRSVTGRFTRPDEVADLVVAARQRPRAGTSPAPTSSSTAA